jgi:hypothetical protein
VRRIFVFASLLLTARAQESVSFNRDIRPIMSDTCFRCHGPDKASRMANLRLDIREEALRPRRQGLAPIVPGEPDRSLIVQRIYASNAAQLMPPASAHKALTSAQKDTIRRWVAEGAKYEGHWAYEPVRRPTPPQTGIHPIDAFVQARLAKHALKPAPEADRRTLIRRVSLDLTGIPPTIEEVESFLNDASPKAYERLIDRLMASPRYAEKQAMHWLDAVRYADTAGFHGDNPFPAWPYRDYILRSIHENQPFDQFTREQLAGDLIPNATAAQRTASAYNRILRVSAEGGIQPAEYLAKYGADRVRTTASVWLGSTIGCAECHDHKFDPFTSRDFYAMKAFFGDIKETGLVPDRGPKAWGSLLDLATPSQQANRQTLRTAFANAKAELERVRPPAESVVTRQSELEWRYQRPLSATAKKATLTIYNDGPVPTTDLDPQKMREQVPGEGIVVASGANPDNETYTVLFAPGPGTWMQLGVQVVSDESLPGMKAARGSDRLMLTEVEAELLPQGRKLRFVAAASNIVFPGPGQHPMTSIDGVDSTGWGVSTYGDSNAPFLALRFDAPLVTSEDSRVVVRLRHDSAFRKATIGRFRLAVSSGPALPVADNPTRRNPKQVTSGLPSCVIQAIKKEASNRTAEENEQVGSALDWISAPAALLSASLRAEAALSNLEAEIPRVMVTEATEPAVTRVLARGNWMDESGPVVEPAIPAFLGTLNASKRATRLDLANWLVSRSNPLTARTYVNRQWRLLFGTGLSRVLEDLGSQGEWPIHPELLDWLAAEFMDSGWDRKHIVKTIVMSHTYRQSSNGETPNDPDNRLLARQNRLRVDAEVVRDIALSVSGLLAERFGGPSVRPYQPEGYLAALNFPKRDYSASLGPDQYRRGLYSVWQRTFLHPSLMAFDAATREECTVNRTASNTPLQALVLLNDPTYVEAARVFAQNAWKASPDPARRIDWAFRRALSRAPNEAEQRVLLALYNEAAERFTSDAAAASQWIAAGGASLPSNIKPVELAAMMTVTRAILNLHETITRN